MGERFPECHRLVTRPSHRSAEPVAPAPSSPGTNIRSHALLQLRSPRARTRACARAASSARNAIEQTLQIRPHSLKPKVYNRRDSPAGRSHLGPPDRQYSSYWSYMSHPSYSSSFLARTNPARILTAFLVNPSLRDSFPKPSSQYGA